MNQPPAQPRPAPTPAPTPKPGILVEDADALEVTDGDGRQRIEKTLDRDALRESMGRKGSGTTPTHKW